MKKEKLLCLIVLVPFLCACGEVSSIDNADHVGGTVILASAEDEYFPLAQYIAKEETAVLVPDWTEALAQNPETVLWVVSPAGLSDETMVEAGLVLKKQSMLPAIGIITGTTQADTQALWLRGQELRATWNQSPPKDFFAANGEYPTAGIQQAQLITFNADQSQTDPMDLTDLTGALHLADYLMFTGHGGDSYLRLDPDTRLETRDLPDMQSLVATANSCQTMRPWSEDSIALGFVNHGAAAFAGFVYSPIEGYMIGGYQDFPFRYSWTDFPIGSIVALQNRGAMQGFADFPFYFLIGDPRIAFQSNPPYELMVDETQDGTRVMTYSNAPSGLIPVRVRGGGHYRYVEVEGVADTMDGDPYFNSLIQAASLNGDKYVLFNHKGGDFTLRLSENPPFGWWMARTTLAAFDHVFLFTPMNGGNWLVLVAGVLAMGFVLFRSWKVCEKPENFTLLIWKSMISGLVITSFIGLYQLFRLPVTSINTKPMVFDGIWLLGVFFLSSCGSWFYFRGGKLWGKFFGLMLAVFPALMPAIFSLAAVGWTNILITQKIGAPVYNYQLGVLPLIAAIIWVMSLWLFLFSINRWLDLNISEDTP